MLFKFMADGNIRQFVIWATVALVFGYCTLLTLIINIQDRRKRPIVIAVFTIFTILTSFSTVITFLCYAIITGGINV